MLDLMQAAKAGRGLPAEDTVSRLVGRSSASPKIYGWHVDPSVSDPSQAVTYLADAVGKTPAAMGESAFSYGSWKNAFFMPRPCMLRYDGTVAYYLNPNDYTKKLDGTPSDIANAEFEGNAMMEWGLIWYKFTAGNTAGEGSFYVSDTQVDDSYKCWCNIDANGDIIPHFYTAIYNGTGTSKLRSLSGAAMTAANGANTITYSQAVSRAAANDPAGKTIWGIDLYSDWQLIGALAVLLGKSLNVQSVFGKGKAVPSESDLDTYYTGTTNDKGMFFGDTSSDDNTVKVFGMENRWGGMFRHISGIATAAGAAYARVKLTYGTADGSSVTGFANVEPSHYINTRIALPSRSQQNNYFISKMAYGDFGMVPSVTNGSYDTYYCDGISRWGYNETNIFAVAGNNNDFTDSNGVFSLDELLLSSSFWTIGAALSCKPTAS